MKRDSGRKKREHDRPILWGRTTKVWARGRVWVHMFGKKRKKKEGMQTKQGYLSQEGDCGSMQNTSAREGAANVEKPEYSKQKKAQQQRGGRGDWGELIRNIHERQQ